MHARYGCGQVLYFWVTPLPDIVDPLTCPKCQGRMKIISFIDDEEVIEQILRYLGLWDLKARPLKALCPGIPMTA